MYYKQFWLSKTGSDTLQPAKRGVDQLRPAAAAQTRQGRCTPAITVPEEGPSRALQGAKQELWALSQHALFFPTSSPIWSLTLVAQAGVQ